MTQFSAFCFWFSSCVSHLPAMFCLCYFVRLSASIWKLLVFTSTSWLFHFHISPSLQTLRLYLVYQGPRLLLYMKISVLTLTSGGQHKAVPSKQNKTTHHNTHCAWADHSLDPKGFNFAYSSFTYTWQMPFWIFTYTSSMLLHQPSP